MLTKNYFESRQTKLLDFSELSKEFIANENTDTKIKKRKSKIFLIMSNKRKEYMTPDSPNINLNLNNTANFIKIFNLIKNKEEKANLINYLFISNITNIKHILLKYQKALSLIIDYNFLSTSSFILDLIEKNDEIIELISQKKENINHLIKIMNLIGNGDNIYDSNYIMITANLLIYSKSINKTLKKEIDHHKIIQLIIKNETIMSYTYFFYIYAYLCYFDAKQMENYENILNSLLLLLNKNNKDSIIFLEDIYDIIFLFSKVQKFSQIFYNNYNIIFGNGIFNEDDILIEQKLSIISSVYKNINSEQIKIFLEKDNGNLLNLIQSSLTIIYDIGYINNINNPSLNYKYNFNLFLLNTQILLTITYHKELTNLLLESKEYFNLIMSIFSYFVSCNNNFFDDKLNEIYNNILKIVNNIIKNEHKLFISQIISNNLHLRIKDKFFYYLNYNCINERHFISLINIIASLYDNQKKDKLKTELVKLDLDNNRFNDVIIGIIKKYDKNKNIKNKCNDFLNTYYPGEPQKNFLQLSDFNFLDLNI
jgi:hypothetical protein